MKKLLFVMVTAAILVLVWQWLPSNRHSESAAKGTAASGEASSSQQGEAALPSALASIYDNVVQKNATLAVQTCQTWQQQLHTAASGERSAELDDGFKKLMQGWKAVEATYIAGDLDVDAIDYPRYIDIFHNSNEDIGQQMQKVLRSPAAADVALSKHSYKTINALEVVLYQSPELSERQLAVARAISANICQRLTQIEQSYAKQRDNFLAQPDQSLSMLINALANQTFSLKDWRIGDVAGLSKRYEGKPDVRRSEYHLSGLSMEAIRTILATQNQLIGAQSYPNFEQITASYGAEKTLQATRQLLTSAQAEAAKLDAPNFDFNPPQTMPLYQYVNQLQNNYYHNLIQALPVVAKILEADGD